MENAPPTNAELLMSIQTLTNRLAALEAQQSMVDERQLMRRGFASLPKFEGQYHFNLHLVALNNWLVSFGIQEEDNRKLALINSIGTSQLEKVQHLAVSKPEYVNSSLDELIGLCRDVFYPVSDGLLARYEFEECRQGEDEPVTSYIARKIGLYETWIAVTGSPEDMPTLVSAVVDSLASNIIRRLCNRMEINSKLDIRLKIPEAVAKERKAIIRGYGEATNLSGLASDVTSYARRRTTEHHSAEPMDISALSTCFACHRPGHRVAGCPDQSKKKAYLQKKKSHKAGDKPKLKREPGVKCDRCHREGHRKMNCKAKTILPSRIEELEDEENWATPLAIEVEEEDPNINAITPFLGKGRARRGRP